MSHRVPLLTALAATLCILVAPAAASADLSLSDVVARPVTGTCQPSASPSGTALAGSHADVCIAFHVNGGSDDLRGLTIHLAPGLLGDPSATPKCSQAGFIAGSCNATQQVGEVATTAVATAPLLGLPLTLDLQGEVYNLAPNPDEPARLGISIEPLGGLASPIHIQSSIRTRLTDYGLDSITRDDLPRTATVLGVPADIAVTDMALTLWGAKGAHPTLAKAFATTPTSCQAATTSIDARAYDGSATGGSDTFTPTDCAHVPFTPSLEVGPEQVPSDTPGEASATLKVPAATGDNRVQANVKRVELLLPNGLTLSPGLANGLTDCTEAQFGLTEDRAPACPASSEIGDVEFVTPLIGTLTGKVYFGTPTPTAKLRNFVSVEDPRLRVKLIGDVTADPVTGQVENVFPDSPQVPFTEFRFHYKGGPNAVLSAPSTCGSFTAVATMTPYNGGAAATPSDSFDTIGCPAPAFTPTLGVSSTATSAGADTALTVQIDRPDRQARLLRSTVSLPPGLAGRLGAVPACPVAQARAAACSESSRVGSANVTVGNGSSPLTLPARVYLTPGFDGAVAGLAIVVPAKVGPIDLGTVVTMAKLRLRPGDAGIDVETEDLPQIIDGIPTPYRSIQLTINRAGFMVNPTSCAPQTVHGAFTAANAMQAAADATYQATACNTLPYAPKLTATLGTAGQTAKGVKPQLTTVVSQGPGEANSRHVEVTLPDGLGANPAGLARACPVEQLDANACPPSAVVGSVRADTPLLAAPLQGPVLIVKPKGGVLPELSLELRGPIDLRLRATVGFGPHGRLKTVFDGIPDVPLSRLALTLNGGKDGILTSGIDLCGRKAPTFDALFQSHSGVQRTGTVNARVPCGAASSNRMRATATLTGIRKHRPALRLKVTAPSRLRELKVTLPRQLRGASSLARVSKLLAGGKSVRKPSLRVKGRTLTVKLPKAGTRTPDLRLRSGALRVAGKLKVGQRVTFTVTGIRVNGKKVTAKATARAQR
jgi:hypothetical protein